jgi:CYTH domain-containing protein
MNSTELERRWICNSLPEEMADVNWGICHTTIKEVSQDSFIRIRLTSYGSYKFCFKSGHGSSRIEIDKEISKSQYEELLEEYKDCHALDMKMAHYYDLQNHRKYDLKKLNNEGRYLIETEFETELEMSQFQLPFTGCTEVTEDPEWEFINIYRRELK